MPLGSSVWQTRKAFATGGAGRQVLADAILGFGIWHVVDSVLSHWVLGIHRIRMDVDNPVFWDLLWFGVFGMVPLALGWLMRRRPPRRGQQLASSPVALALAALAAAPIAALPPPGQSTAMVLFRPDVTPAQAFAAMRAIGGRLLWSDPSGQLWAIDVSGGGDAGRLYGYGALLVSSAGLPVGCFNWTRA